MIIKLKGTVINRIERSVHADIENYPVRLGEYSYELDDPNFKGLAKVHYLVHEMDEGDLMPLLFRGFMKFEGEILKQKGSFLAHEDGAIHRGSTTIKGRIVDATEELSMLVGSYSFYQALADEPFDLLFDIEL